MVGNFASSVLCEVGYLSGEDIDNRPLELLD